MSFEPLRSNVLEIEGNEQKREGMCPKRRMRDGNGDADADGDGDGDVTG
jgi:hypothetical protein